MSTLNGNVLPMYERVIHIAFGCACVRTFNVGELTMNKCPTHGDRMISTTEELVPKKVAA